MVSALQTLGHLILIDDHVRRYYYCYLVIDDKTEVQGD